MFCMTAYIHTYLCLEMSTTFLPLMWWFVLIRSEVQLHLKLVFASDSIQGLRFFWWCLVFRVQDRESVSCCFRSISLFFAQHLSASCSEIWGRGVCSLTSWLNLSSRQIFKTWSLPKCSSFSSSSSAGLSVYSFFPKRQNIFIFLFPDYRCSEFQPGY